MGTVFYAMKSEKPTEKLEGKKQAANVAAQS